MRKFTPWLLLIPAVALLIGLPGQLQGRSPFRMQTVSYVLSIFIWLFAFCGVFALSRKSSWSRLFFILAALVVLVDTGYQLWVGPHDWLHIAFLLVVLWLAIGLARSSPSAKNDDTT